MAGCLQSLFSVGCGSRSRGSTNHACAKSLEEFGCPNAVAVPKLLAPVADLFGGSVGGGLWDFAKAIGLSLDASANGLGIRSKRYCMVVEDGVVKSLNVEEAPGKADVSGADNLMKLL